MKNKQIFIGIIMCTWYMPVVFLISLVSGFLNHSSFESLLLPIIMIASYGFGLFFVFDITTETRMIEPVPEQNKQQEKITICWNCKTQYYYMKNEMGDTVVQCPQCRSKGLIK